MSLDRRKNIQSDIQKRAEAMALQLSLVSNLQAVLIFSHDPNEAIQLLPPDISHVDPVMLANCLDCISQAVDYAKKMVKL